MCRVFLSAALVGLLALLLAIPASAQVAATWDEDNNRLYRQTIPNAPTVQAFSGGYRCARWDTNNRLTIPTFNTDLVVAGVCVDVNTSNLWKTRLYLIFGADTDVATIQEKWPLRALWESSGNGDIGDDGFLDGDTGDSLSSSTQSGMTGLPYVRSATCTGSSSQPCSAYAYSASVDATWTGTKLSLYLSPSEFEAPSTPARITISRSSDYSEATISWELYEPVSLYEIERLEAVTVSADDTSRIEYGDPERFQITGTFAGVDEYVDTTLDANTTYRYRIRARGATADDWSDWSDWIFSGGKRAVDLDAPSNVRLSRLIDNSSITIIWSAPQNALDGYTVQRQELVVLEGSSFFANVVTLGPSGGWIAATATSYEDTSVVPGNTYEYRVAAVREDSVGDYSEWARASPRVTSFGQPPPNFRLSSEPTRRDDRREFWLAWDEVDGADDYELQVREADLATGAPRLDPSIVVTHNTYFDTIYGRVEYRVRGRMEDDDICGSGSGDRCYTEWTGWIDEGYVPAPQLVAVSAATISPDAAAIKLKEDLEEVIGAGLDPLGASTDAADVLAGGVLAFIFIMAGVCFVLGHRAGMAPLGFAIGMGLAVMILWLGILMVDLPVEWGIMVVVAVFVLGGVSLVRANVRR